jgi:Ni/Co efflux regulator RcnB
MIGTRRLLTILAAALLAGAPGLAAQSDTPNPFGQPRAEGQQRQGARDDHPRWRRGRHLERRGERAERRGERWERHGERLRHHHQHRRYHRRQDGRV